MNLSLAVSFRATFLKTVRLSKRVLRESGSDRNFCYFCNIPTVSWPLLQFALDLLYTHIGVSKMAATKRHLLDVLALCVGI